MNPYLSNVIGANTQQSNQNLFENVLPQVNSTFTGAGQFGSSRNAEFMNRAIRDNQQVLSNTNSKALLDAQNAAAAQYSDWANKGMTAGSGIGNLAGIYSNAASGVGQAGQGVASLAGQVGSLGTSLGQMGAQQGALGGIANQSAQLQSQIGQTQAGILNQGAQGAGTLASGMVNAANSMGNVANSMSGLATTNNALNKGYLDYGNYLTNQANVGNTLTQQQFNNLAATGQNFMTNQQAGLTNSYQDWQEEDFPLSALAQVGQTAAQNAGTVRPDVTSYANPMDDFGKMIEAVRTLGASGEDISGLWDQMYGLFNGNNAA